MSDLALPRRASTVIVGGGIQGLSLAFELAALGRKGIVVIDAGYFQGGASGRNGTMIRAGFMSPAWTALFALAQRRWIELSGRLRRNVMYSKRGYLLIAERASTAEPFDRAVALHREHGVRSQRISKARLRKLAPALDDTQVLEALYLDDGGVAPHHAVMHAYLDACRASGVEVRYGVPVKGFARSSAGVQSVVTEPGTVEVDSVVIAAGAYANRVVGLAGLELPGFPMRIEAMALEPTRQIIRPGIALLDRLCYLSQTARGEIVGGAEVLERPHETLASDLPSLAATARAYRAMLPCLGSLRILRHWAGMIHVTADFSPLIGTHPECPNMWVSGGWAYGFASAPGVSELLAKAIHTGIIDAALKPFAIERFARGMLVREGGIVLAPAPDPTSVAVA
jgi:sarcosine oxidase subunit beta